VQRQSGQQQARGDHHGGSDEEKRAEAVCKRIEKHWREEYSE
jgi:hypothetical protein